MREIDSAFGKRYLALHVTDLLGVEPYNLYQIDRTAKARRQFSVVFTPKLSVGGR
jgi:hypothetical protein